MVNVPVFIQNAAPDDLFGMTPNPACNVSVCYNESRRERYWGCTTGFLNW